MWYNITILIESRRTLNGKDTDMRKFKTLSHGDWKRQIATGTHAELTALLADD